MKFKRPIKYYLLRLFRLNESPHQVALGLTLGFVPSWFPTFGLGPVFSAGLAKITKVNMIAAVIGGIIGTPFWPVLFMLNYQTGSFFSEEVTKANEREGMDYIEVVTDTLGGLQTGTLQFLLGAFINVLIISFFLYFIVYMIFKKYRVNILARLK